MAVDEKSIDILQVIEADLTWTGEKFEPGVRVAVDSKGRIATVGADGGKVTMRLPNRALLPGMVNVHSHAFQRGLRGRGEEYPKGEGNFWTWREAMYELVTTMDEQSIYTLSKQAFEEMLAAGVTTVGEFHYLHHDASCAGFALDEVVLRAAKDAGIRIVLINTYYKTGGVDQPLEGGQLRFRCRNLDEFWAQMDVLATKIDPATQSLGAAGHSIRAVPIEDFVLLQQEADKRGLVFHSHVEEQQAEISACVGFYHKTPMALLTERLVLSPRFTAIHCTHSASADLDNYLETGANICLCPVTEGNLGDGFANVPRMINHQASICIGSDSNVRISFAEEMRMLEFGQRLVGQRRGVCVDAHGRVAEQLFKSATVHGARSLNQRVGSIREGHCADFFTVDLNHAAVLGWNESTLLPSFIFGTSNEAIADVCVGGKWRDVGGK